MCVCVCVKMTNLKSSTDQRRRGEVQSQEHLLICFFTKRKFKQWYSTIPLISTKLLFAIRINTNFKRVKEFSFLEYNLWQYNLKIHVCILCSFIENCQLYMISNFVVTFQLNLLLSVFLNVNFEYYNMGC